MVLNKLEAIKDVWNKEASSPCISQKIPKLGTDRSRTAEAPSDPNNHDQSKQ
jgi:hypothetical protein